MRRGTYEYKFMKLGWISRTSGSGGTTSGLDFQDGRCYLPDVDRSVQKGVIYMIGMIRKAVLAGIGASVLAKEKIEELARRGESEQPKFVKDLFSRAEEEKKRVEAKLEEAIRKALERLQVATKADIDALSKKIDSLARRRE